MSAQHSLEDVDKGWSTRMVERLINPEDAHVHVSFQTRETETDSMRVAREPNILYKDLCSKPSALQLDWLSPETTRT